MISLETKEIESLINQNRYDEVKERLEKEEENCQTQLLYTYYYSAIGNYDKEVEYANKILQCPDASVKQKIIAQTHIGWARFRWGEYDRAEGIALAAERIIELNAGITDFSEEYCAILDLKGSICAERGNLDNSENYYRELVKIREVDGESQYYDVAGAYNNLAFVLQKKGSINEAMHYYQLAYNIFSEHDHLRGIAVTKSNIAEIHRLKAETQKSLELHLEVLKLRKRGQNEYGLALSLQYVGVIEMELGNLDAAEDYFRQSLEYWDHVGNPQWQSATLLNYGKLLLAKGKDAKSVVSELHDLWLSTNFDVIKHRYYLMKALELKSVPRMATIADAQIYLEKIDKDPMLDYEVTYSALIELCNILFQELKISDDIGVYSEVKLLIERLERLARDNNAYLNIIEVLFLKSKMALADLDYEKSDALLTQTELLIEENELMSLKPLVKKQRKLMENDIKTLNQLLQRDNDVIARAKLLQLTDYLVDAYEIAEEEKTKLDES